MKYFVATLAIVAVVAASAVAGMNPDIKTFVDFSGTATDNAGVVNTTSPTAYTGFTAYFGITDFSCMTTISFYIASTPGMSAPASFTSLLPGGLAIGDWSTGITLSSTDQMGPGAIDDPPTDPTIYFASGSYFYLGVPGGITIEDHPDYPLWVVDCDDEVDFYCVWLNGGVGGFTPPAGDVGCEANVPVEQETWGSIKALYR